MQTHTLRRALLPRAGKTFLVFLLAQRMCERPVTPYVNRSTYICVFRIFDETRVYVACTKVRQTENVFNSTVR